MPSPTATYDLVMLLDPEAEETARAKIVADTRAAIEGKGELVRHDEWGERPLTYPIERRASAEYHLLQFHVGDGALLGELDHTLRITDGLLRFRVVKLKPGVPDAPDMRAGAARRGEAEPSAPSASSAESAEPSAERAEPSLSAEPSQADGGSDEPAAAEPQLAEPA
jgi:small subunit ribosomal protein S6